MTRIMILLSILAILSIAATLNPPVDYPATLDELWYKIESQEYGWTFTPCDVVQAPFFTWQQARAIRRLATEDDGLQLLIIDNRVLSRVLSMGGVRYPNHGTLVISENELFAIVARSFLRPFFDTSKPYYDLCGDASEYPIITGAGVQLLFDEVR